MEIDDEQRGRRDEAGLRADQPAVRAPVETPRALVQLLGIAANVPAVGSACAGALRRAADVEQRVPVAARLIVLALGEDDQRGAAQYRQPFPVVRDGPLEG